MNRSEDTRRRLRNISLLPVFVLLSLMLCMQELSAQDGQALFKQNCAACHSSGTQKLAGPGLQGINGKRKAEWLIKWIKSPQSLVSSGDADAKALVAEFGQVMPDQKVTDEEIKAILKFLDAAPATAAEPASPSTAAAPAPPGQPFDKWWIYALLIVAVVAIAGVFLLRRMNSNLERAGLRRVKFFDYAAISSAVGRSIVRNKKLVALLGVVVVFIGMRGCWNTLMNIGVTQNYQPVQPIAFSHRIHAGDNNINCRYCHNSAWKGKTAGIPSANVCMNCHRYIQKGKETGTTEISKIYTALDYNPETGEYGKNTKPIAWVRVHNLPDLSYFNHAQHVVAGKQACKTCHGSVEKMDTVYQFSKLTMGWCINCHRETEVPGMKSNPYYESMHKKLKERYQGQKITVDKMGGLDCSKCHY